MEIIKEKYLTIKEASRRYGFSIAWFRERRRLKLLPFCTKFNGKGKILYPLEQTDRWFVENINKENY